MDLYEYLNQLYDSDDLYDYKYGKIDLEMPGLSESDKETLGLVLEIIRLDERYEDKENVFEQYSRNLLPELKSIKKQDLAPLLSLDLNLFPLPIRARVADFLWTTIMNHVAARIAIHSYLELYDKVWNEDDWPDCIEAIHRAVNIAERLNKKGEEYKETIEAVQKGLDHTKGNDPLFLSSSLLEILAEQKYKIDEDLRRYARNAIETAKRTTNFTKAQIVLEALAKLDQENRNQYYEEAGDITQAMAFNPAIRRVQILNQALQYYVKAGTKEKQAQCRKQLEEAQSHILDELQVIKTDPIDITSSVKEVHDALRKASNVKQAIIIFGSLCHIYKRDELLKYIKDYHGLADLFPPTRVDHNGRQICSLPALSLERDLNLDNEVVRKYMWDKARSLQEMYADIILNYALSEINRLYQYTEEDLDFLVRDNAIIHDRREEIIRKGLYLGIQGDLYTAMHLLIPQTENIIRNLVKICGGQTFYVEDNGDITIKPIGQLLKSPEFNDCYDPDIIFCLQGLLDQKEGSNLRNEMAHGLMEPGNSRIGLYFLGLITKLLSLYSRACMEESIKMKEKQKDE